MLESRSNVADDWIHIYVSSPIHPLKVYREQIAARVGKYFRGSLSTPARSRVLCYLADNNAFQPFFGGPENRGFHVLLETGLKGWPEHIRDLVNLVSATNLIYVHGSTCESDIALTMTLSHELQHFLQCSNYRRLWAVESLFQKLIPNADLKAHWETPSEMEARIVAKKVAYACFAREHVDNYITERIEQATSLRDRENWRFIQSLDPTAEYDFVQETEAILKRHKPELKWLQALTENAHLPAARLLLDSDLRVTI